MQKILELNGEVESEKKTAADVVYCLEIKSKKKKWRTKSKTVPGKKKQLVSGETFSKVSFPQFEQQYY